MSYTKITDSVFWAAKTLFKGGASNKEVCDYLKLSSYTVNFIKKAETPEEYRNMVFAAHNPKPKKAESEIQTPAQIIEHRQSVTIQATHYMETELRAHTEILKCISAKLANMMENMEKIQEAWSK